MTSLQDSRELRWLVEIREEIERRQALRATTNPCQCGTSATGNQSEENLMSPVIEQAANRVDVRKQKSLRDVPESPGG